MTATTRLPPYLIVGGRTKPSRAVAIESLIERAGAGAGSGRPRFESAKILAAADRPVSVAEVSTQLGLPLGATLVLVADLLDSDDLIAHDTVEQSSIPDREIMTRIIHRVREL